MELWAETSVNMSVRCEIRSMNGETAAGYPYAPSRSSLTIPDSNSRVQAVVNELQGEKIDIIPWNEDQPTFLVNALQPAEVSKVVLDEDAERIEVVVPDEQLSLAIGRRGQNVRLASQLTGHQIDIMTEEEASEKRSKEFAERSKMFEEELDVDETLSQLLVAEGFAELEEVAYVELAELASIEGFDEELGEELQNRAKEALDRHEEAARTERRELGVEDDLAEIPHLSEQMLVTLGKGGIKTLDDLADLATDELIQKKREAPRRRNNADGPPMRRPSVREQDKGGVLGYADEVIVYFQGRNQRKDDFLKPWTSSGKITKIIGNRRNYPIGAAVNWLVGNATQPLCVN